ncbi:MAG: 16S rRNA (guanine(527)-N(7))-methyltransferase RsmG [Bacteroidales bacterium]
MELQKHIPRLTDVQLEMLAGLEGHYRFWNERINVISRKDMEHFTERHLLHSLSIAFWFDFKPGTTILDVGTGGGFPGIPLAVLFPEVEFTLVDSIAKKIRVVQEIATAVELNNVRAVQARVEQMHERFDYVVSRAVTRLPEFVRLTAGRVARKGFNDMPNGILYLKGGDFGDELAELNGWNQRLYHLQEKLTDPFFETKKLVFLSRDSLS